MSTSPRLLMMIVGVFVVGLLAGAFLFSDVERRSLLAVHNCEQRCLNANEVAGLLASIGLQKFSGAVPRSVKETEKTVAIEYQPGWFVVFPKQDGTDAAALNESDIAYLADIYAVMGELVRERRMTNWQIFTNGPDIQHIRYLHFHLMDRTQTSVIPKT